jgi:hypothetical protein
MPGSWVRVPPLLSSAQALGLSSSGALSSVGDGGGGLDWGDIGLGPSAGEIAGVPRDPCSRGNCTQSQAGPQPDPANKFGPPVGPTGVPGVGVTLPTASAPLADVNVSVDATAGPVAASFASDATSVNISPSVGLKIMVSATYRHSDPSFVTGSFGGDFGEGVLYGGGMEYGNHGISSISAKLGIGVQWPIGGKWGKRLSIGGVTFHP